jgi:hypothetical protein
VDILAKRAHQLGKFRSLRGGSAEKIINETFALARAYARETSEGAGELIDMIHVLELACEVAIAGRVD